jgi:hypothetical protein
MNNYIKFFLLEFAYRQIYKHVKSWLIESWILLSSSGRMGKEDVFAVLAELTPDLGADPAQYPIWKCLKIA